jgi:hypothetical protein
MRSIGEAGLGAQKRRTMRHKVKGFTIEPSGNNTHLFRRIMEPKHCYNLEITSQRTIVHSISPVDVGHRDPEQDAKRFLPDLKEAAEQFQRETFG